MTMALPPPTPPEETPAWLDAALRTALVAEPPAALTARLLQLTQPTPTRLDQALTASLVVAPPAALTAQLLALVPQPAAVTAPSAATPRWRMAIYALTALALGVLLLVVGVLFQQTLTQLGAAELWSQLVALPGEGLARLYAVAPRAQVVVALYQQLQRPLQVVLAGLLLWAALEMRPLPQRRLA